MQKGTKVLAPRKGISLCNALISTCAAPLIRSRYSRGSGFLLTPCGVAFLSFFHNFVARAPLQISDTVLCNPRTERNDLLCIGQPVPANTPAAGVYAGLGLACGCKPVRLAMRTALAKEHCLMPYLSYLLRAA